MPQPRPPSLLLGGLLGVLLIALTGCATGNDAAQRPPEAAPAAYHGVQPEPVAARPSFALRDTDGAAYDFAQKTRGRPTLLYFGYTSCPDECPTAMADIAGALRETTPELRSKTVVVFVTTDPARDNPALLRRWLDMFSPEFVALVGTQAEVDAAQLAVGVRPAARGGAVETLPGRPDEHEHQPGSAPHRHLGPLGYGVAHADTIFAFDADDRLPVLYPAGVRPSDIAADLPLLAQGDSS